jgi:hypothetical protein
MLLSFERPAAPVGSRSDGAPPRQAPSRRTLKTAQLANKDGYHQHRPYRGRSDHRQDMKGIRWMPWHQESMKGVDDCDKPR